MEKAIGIDLGTTFSAVSIIDETGHPVILKNVLGENLTPSVICFENDGTVLVGAEAKERQAFGEENVASFFKRNMGDALFSLSFHGKTYSATDLSAILLRKLKEDAEAVLNCPVGKAVITVPAYFNDLQKKATIKAAETAGLKVLRIINEPTAAAIAFGVSQERNQTIMVYDLGGGTFDVTILQIQDGQIRVIATGGDHELGGKDWDNCIIGYAASQFQDEFGEDPLSDSVAFNDLLVQAESAKKRLSSMQSAKVSLVYNGNRGNYEITRDMFEEITTDLMQKTTSKAEEVLAEARLTWEHLDGVLLVGGSTRMPMVSRWVTSVSGKPPITGINVDEAVCLGAAIQAQIEQSKKGGLSLPPAIGGKISLIEDVMSHSLGMLAENGDRSQYINSVIIPKNRPVPITQMRPYKLSTYGGNDTLELFLVQGECENLRECVVVGHYMFSGVEPGRKDTAVVEVEYQYDENGTVQISAKQQETGKSLQKKELDIPADMEWMYGSPKDREKHIKQSPELSVVIAVDLSGSMSGDPLEKAKEAARGFLSKLNLRSTSIALVPFANGVEVSCPLSKDVNEIRRGIDSWVIGSSLGYGNSGQPFTKSMELLNNGKGAKFLIVLTDGCWSNSQYAIQQAQICAQAEINIIAIGFGSADYNFLKQIATADENALFTNLGDLVVKFNQIAQVISAGGHRGLRC